MQLSKIIFVGIVAAPLGASPTLIEVPTQVTIAEMVRQSVQPHSYKSSNPITPRLSTKPVLTGSEMFSVDSFRAILETQDPSANGYQTAREVLIAANGVRAGPFGVVGETATHLIGWAQLWRNWALATMLGDGLKADQYLGDAYEIWEVMGSTNDSDPSSRYLSASDSAALSITLSGLLRSTAGGIGDDAAVIPQAVDPEGYVRQRLSFVYDHLLSGATALQDLVFLINDDEPAAVAPPPAPPPRAP